MSGILDIREVGQYPLTIGTSLAIESLLGIAVDVDGNPTQKINQATGSAAPLFEFDEVWVNLRTLVRNIMGGISAAEKKRVEVNDLCEVLYSEMGVITTEINAVKQTPVVFYASDMDLSKYTNAKLRKASTEIKIWFEKLSVDSIGRVFNHFKKNPTDLYKLKHFKLKIEPDMPTKAVILTNFPIDLVNWQRFKELVLLESHTGVLKPRAEWYTKYFNGKEKCKRIPFNEKFLQIFGDKETFSPLDQKYRDDILAVAEKYKWTPLTTPDKVSYGIKTLKNHYFTDYYLKL